MLELEPDSCPTPTLPAASHCALGETEAQKEEEPGPRLHQFFEAFRISTPAPASVSPFGCDWHCVAAGSNLSGQWLGLKSLAPELGIGSYV